MVSIFTYHFSLPPLSASSMMNTLYKSLTNAILVISTFISVINVDPVGVEFKIYYQDPVLLKDGFFLFDPLRRQR
jgi:hypothetical protein